jgi:ABC-type glutathione transport system ATPase component
VSLKYVCQQDTQPQSHRQPHRQLPADLTAALEFYLAIRLTGSPTGALVQGIRMLELVGVSNVVDGVTTIDDVNLSLSDDGINILLGPTLSGKTSLMRIMAGLDKPSAGDVLFEGGETDAAMLPVFGSLSTSFVRRAACAFVSSMECE